MNFYDSLINEVNELTCDFSRKSYPYDEASAWHDVGYSQVILQRDTAYELSGTGFNLITSAEIADEIVVIGENLGEIKGDRKFARISIIQLDDAEDEQKLYSIIRKVEYVKYHYFPDGYMIRTTSRSHKEAVRISKKALKGGIDFQKAGALLIKKYKENPSVKGVKVIFITCEEADYGGLDSVAQKSNGITEALNHVMNSINFDCDTCKLKPVCDEVEGMKELHFKNSAQKGM